MTQVAPVQERALWFLDELLRIRVRGEQTGGSLSVVEILAPRGPASPLHVQPREDETFYVLDGELTFHLDGAERAASTGDVVVVPRGTPHAYRVDSETARVLLLDTPAGHERFFEAMGRPAERDELPGAPDGPPDMAAWPGPRQTRASRSSARRPSRRRSAYAAEPASEPSTRSSCCLGLTLRSTSVTTPCSSMTNVVRSAPQ